MLFSIILLFMLWWTFYFLLRLACRKKLIWLCYLYIITDPFQILSRSSELTCFYDVSFISNFIMIVLWSAFVWMNIAIPFSKNNLKKKAWINFTMYDKVNIQVGFESLLSKISFENRHMKTNSKLHTYYYFGNNRFASLKYSIFYQKIYSGQKEVIILIISYDLKKYHVRILEVVPSHALQCLFFLHLALLSFPAHL